jgi:polyisoprenoid-binding protein YceI
MRISAIAATLALVAACTQPAEQKAPSPPTPVTVDAPSGAYTLDKAHSSLVLRVSHFGLSRYTLRLADLDAALDFNAEDPTKSRLTATAAANSVSTEFRGGVDFNGELEGSQWLDAATHPTIAFTSSSLELTGENTGRMTGELELRGVKRPATFDVTFNRAYRQHPMGRPGALLGFSARGTILRSEFGMTRLLPQTSGGVGVADEVEVEIEAEFTQGAAPVNPEH